MTAPTLRHALALTFSWATAGASADISIKVGATTYTGGIASGDYRILLGYGATPGGTTEPLADFLQVVAARCTAALTGPGRTVTCTLGADGRVVLAVDSGTFDVNPKPFMDVLGFTPGVALTGAGSYTATYPPRYFATFIGRQGDGRQARVPGAWDTDEAGRVYGVTSGVVTRTESMEFTFLPTDTDLRASLAVDQTAWEPTAANYGTLGSTTLAAPWTVLDLLTTGGGKVWALADANLQALRASTSSANRYHLGTVSPADLTAPRAPQQFPDWSAYRKLTLTFVVRSSSPTGTRS